MVGSLCELRSGAHSKRNISQDFLPRGSWGSRVSGSKSVRGIRSLRALASSMCTGSSILDLSRSAYRVRIYMTKRTSIKFLDTKKRDGLFFPSPPMDLGARPSGDRTHRGSGSLAGCDVPYKLLLVAMTGARSCCLHSTPDYASNLCASDDVWRAPGLPAFSVFPNARQVLEKYPYALIFRSFLLNKSHFSLLI